MIIYTVIVSLLLLGVFWRRKRKNYNLPPGPPGLPLIGNLHQLVCKNPYQKLSDWAKEYGKIYTLGLATERTIVINDQKLLNDVFGHFASTGKFNTEMFLVMTRGNYGVLNTDGRDALEQRTFLMTNLIKLGLSNRSMEYLLLEEIQELVEWIKKENKKCKEDEGIVLNESILLTGLNGLWTLGLTFTIDESRKINGQRIALEDSKMAKLITESVRSMLATVETGLVVLPWLKYFAPNWSGYNRLMTSTGKAMDYLKESVAEHQKTYTPGAPRDLIDCYVEEMNDPKNGNPSPLFHGPTGMKHTLATLIVVLSAGSDTTSNVLIFLLFYLTQYPQVQKKVYAEIENIIGSHRNPTFADKANMDAVVQEVFRFSSTGPVGVLHRLLEDVEFEGYSMPKGSLLLANIFHIHFDKNIWTDPENFRPERFLDCNESMRNSVCLFQPGKRSCPGEFLVKDTLFLFGVKLLQNFEVQADPSVPGREYIEPDVTYTLAPKHLKVIMKPRF